MTKMDNIAFRDAAPDDAEGILKIYQYYVEKTAITFEWTVPGLEEFRERMIRTMKKYPYIVAETDGRIVGYAYAGPFVGREAYDWSVEMTIYLDHEARHKGLGKRLYGVMENILKAMHVLNLYACIGYPKVEDAYLTKNSARFHEHLGYRMAGQFHDCGFKFGRWYDMVWMEKMIGDHPPVPLPVINYNELKGTIRL